jgi:hypothetical protein
MPGVLDFALIGRAIAYIASVGTRSQVIRNRKYTKLMEQKKVLTEKEAAEYLGFSSILLRNIRKRRSPLPEIPYSQVGKSIRYRIEDLEAWLLSQQVPKTEKRHA